ncbi:hypothetical protein GCM10009610_48250 [Pseudonocardia xinjiangensis]
MITRAPRRTRVIVIGCALALLFAVPIVAASGLGHARATAGAQQRLAGPIAVAPVAQSAAEPGRGSQSAPAPPASPRREVARAVVAAAEGAAAGTTELAVAVLDRETGELALGARGAEPYYTASLSKVVVAVDILDRRRLEGLAVADPDIALLRRSLGPSDDGAMNTLWSRFDGVGAVGRVSSRLGLSGTAAPRDPSQWGEVSVPAADTVKIWQHILDEMPPADRDLLVSAMDAAPPQAADGFNQAYGLLAPAVDGPGAPGAVAKQGWMCCFSGKYYMHSTGAVGPDRRFVVALLTRVPRAPGWEVSRQELTRIATAATQAMA